MPFLTSEQIETLVHAALTGPEIERPSALFNLLKIVSDPAGNEERYECALEAMRVADRQTQEYEAWFQKRVGEPLQTGQGVTV